MKAPFIVRLYPTDGGEPQKIATFDCYEDVIACLGGEECAAEDGVYKLVKDDAE